MHWSLVTPPTLDPVTVSLAKQWLRVADAEVGQDEALDLMIKAATARVQAFLHHKLITQTVRQTYSFVPVCVDATDYPVQEIAALGYVDCNGNAQSLSLAHYELLKSRSNTQIVRGSDTDLQFPDEVKEFSVDLIVGYGGAVEDVPADFRTAILMLVSHYFENREAVVAGSAATEMPLGVEDLLTRHIRWV